MQKSVRIAVAAVVAVAGLGISLALSSPPHQVAVAVLTKPAEAGVAIPAAALTTEQVPETWAQSSHLLSKAQAAGFIPSTALPAGVPLALAERLNTVVPAQNVSLPLAIDEGSAEGVHPGSLVAIYTAPSGQNGAGALDAEGVKILNVIAPAGTPSTTTSEVVMIEVPTTVAPALVGQTLVMADMGGRPTTHWFVTGVTGSSSATTGSTGNTGSTASAGTTKSTSTSTSKQLQVGKTTSKP